MRNLHFYLLVAVLGVGCGRVDQKKCTISLCGYKISIWGDSNEDKGDENVKLENKKSLGESIEIKQNEVINEISKHNKDYNEPKNKKDIDGLKKSKEKDKTKEKYVRNQDLTYDNVKLFYNEYKETIRMPTDAPSYELNWTSINKWQDKMQQEGYEYFAKKFASSIQHISFEVFLKKLQNIAKEIVSMIDGYENICFVAPGCNYKSSAWGFLLLFGEIDKIILQNANKNIDLNKFTFFNNTSEVKDYYEINYKPKTLCIVCDDMSYSGLQISSEFDLINKEIDYYLATPYIGSTAKNYLDNDYNNIVKYFNTMKQLESFEELFKQDDKFLQESFQISQASEMNKGVGSHCIYDPEMIPVYFDFKIADNRSIPYYIFLTGCIPQKPHQQLTEFTPFIKNYKLNFKPNKSIYELSNNGESLEFDRTSVTPLTFYKRKEYCRYNNELFLPLFTQIKASQS